MEKTYKFELPQNKEVVKTNIRVDDGKVFVDVEFKEKFCPKDGDFCISDTGLIFVNKKACNGEAQSYIGITRINSRTPISLYGAYYRINENARFATPEEKSAFLERLESEYHKKWNAKEKCLEDIFVPKFGDIVRIECPNKIHDRNYIISIFPDKVLPKKSVSNFFDIAVIDLAGCLRICDASGYYNHGNVRLASESEKQELFNKLAEVGKRWNETTKELEDIRWQPNNGDAFYYVDVNGEVKSVIRTPFMDFLEEFPNCFKTAEAARPYAEKVKEIFKSSKAE